MTAARLFNIKNHYIGESVFYKDYFTNRSLHEIASYQLVPENLPSDIKKEVVISNNKVTKSRPPTILRGHRRPSLSDMEIALIVSSYDNTPTPVISHTLGITDKMVKLTYNAYKNNNIPSIPMVMITDTSRYLNKDILRTIYPADEVNNPDDPLTDKELLRNDVQPQHDVRIYQEFHRQQIKRGNTIGELTRLRGNLRPSRHFEEVHLALHGRTWSNEFERVFSKGVLNSYSVIRSSFPYFLPYYVKSKDKYNNDIHLYNKSYYDLYGTRQHTYLIKAVLENIKHWQTSLGVELEDSSFTTSNIYLLNTILNSNPNKLGTLYTKNKEFIYDNKGKLSDHKHELIYTTDSLKLSNYRPKPDNPFYIPYNIVRPCYTMRSQASPLTDLNNNIRYRLNNETYKKFELKEYKPKGTEYYIAIKCLVCDSLVFKHGGTTCQCGKVTAIFNDYTNRNINKSNIKLKPIKLKIKGKLKEFIENHSEELGDLNTDGEYLISNKEYVLGKSKHLFPKSKLDIPKGYNMYTSSNRYKYNYRLSTKSTVEVFIDTTTDIEDQITAHLYQYSHHLKRILPHKLGVYNLTPYDVLPLYIDFHLPISNTSQEPILV